MGDILSKMQQQLVRNTQIGHWPAAPYRGNRQQSFDSNLEQILWNIRKLEQMGDGGAMLDH